jgi:hypothetical protein
MGRDFLAFPHLTLTPARLAAVLEHLRALVGQSEPPC